MADGEECRAFGRRRGGMAASSKGREEWGAQVRRRREGTGLRTLTAGVSEPWDGDREEWGLGNAKGRSVAPRVKEREMGIPNTGGNGGVGERKGGVKGLRDDEKK